MCEIKQLSGMTAAPVSPLRRKASLNGKYPVNVRTRKFAGTLCGVDCWGGPRTDAIEKSGSDTNICHVLEEKCLPTTFSSRSHDQIRLLENDVICMERVRLFTCVAYRWNTELTAALACTCPLPYDPALHVYSPTNGARNS